MALRLRERREGHTPRTPCFVIGDVSATDGFFLSLPFFLLRRESGLTMPQFALLCFRMRTASTTPAGCTGMFCLPWFVIGSGDARMRVRGLVTRQRQTVVCSRFPNQSVPNQSVHLSREQKECSTSLLLSLSWTKCWFSLRIVSGFRYRRQPTSIP